MTWRRGWLGVVVVVVVVAVVAAVGTEEVEVEEGVTRRDGRGGK